MKLGTIVKWSYVLGVLITLFGAYLKISHSSGAETLLIIGIVATLIFIVSAIYEVNISIRINRSEKIMWTIAFLFMSGFTGIIYFLMGRKRVV